MPHASLRLILFLSLFISVTTDLQSEERRFVSNPRMTLGTNANLSAAVRIADLNGDGFVDAADMGAMLALWGEAESAADLNEDGAVDAQDLGLLLVEWGPCS